MSDYKDIINYEYTGPKNHQRMTRALTGYEDNLSEARRIVDERIILNEDKKNELDDKLNSIEKDLSNKIKLTYFIKDLKKTGGFYKIIETKIKKIDSINKEIILINNIKIKIENIFDIEILGKDNYEKN